MEGDKFKHKHKQLRIIAPKVLALVFVVVELTTPYTSGKGIA